MKSVLVRIQEYSAQASGAEKGVLRFLRENPEEAAGYSITVSYTHLVPMSTEGGRWGAGLTAVRPDMSGFHLLTTD